jgi:hypothetical protein
MGISHQLGATQKPFFKWPKPVRESPYCKKREKYCYKAESTHFIVYQFAWYPDTWLIRIIRQLVDNDGASNKDRIELRIAEPSRTYTGIGSAADLKLSTALLGGYPVQAL